MKCMLRTGIAAAMPVALLLVAGLNAASRAVLWTDPGNIAEKDLFWGSGSPRSAPQPPFEFLKEDTSGTKPKVRIRDARGTEWNVKFRINDPQGDEVPAEVAASRFAWALGYGAEECYFVPGGQIQHLSELSRKSPYLSADGTFVGGARFEKRPASVEQSDTRWSFEKNSFDGTRELSGLKILMALVSNWDNHDSNNKIVIYANAAGGPEERHLVADWGSSFGRMDKPGFLTNRSRWHVDGYRHQRFVKGVLGSDLLLHYKGFIPIEAVPIEHARWFSRLASALTRRQAEQAFAAAGASTEEISAFSSSVLRKIDELRVAVNCHTLSPCSPARPAAPHGSPARGAPSVRLPSY